MKYAWMHIFAVLIVAGSDALASESAKVMAVGHGGGHGAVETLKAGELITAQSEPKQFVGKDNVAYELSPRSVAEFGTDGKLKLLRGSVYVATESERSVRTSSADIDFVGEALISYDYKEKSTSAFVLDGQARILNPSEPEKTLLLDRFRGATIVVGEVFPRLIRDLSLAGVDGWLKGYAWPEMKRRHLLRSVPSGNLAAKEPVPTHLAQVKLEDYFSAIDNLDEADQPDYYRKKFADPDQVIAEAASKKKDSSLSPEDAALIALPTTKINLNMELPVQIVSDKEKRRELMNMKASVGASRGLASVEVKAAVPERTASKPSASEGRESDLEFMLRQIRSAKATGPLEGRDNDRAPASVGPIPDPVYDFSQNF